MLFFMLVLLLAQKSWAGPVNQIGSFPIAAMNAGGDFLIGGNWSALIRWKDHFVRLKEDLDTDRDVFYSGGIAQYPVDSAAAILCGGSQVFIFHHKDMRWQKHLSLDASTHLGGRIRCAMNEDGTWGAFDLATGLLHLAGGSITLEPSLRAWLTSNGRNFLLMTEGGLLRVIDPKGTILASYPMDVGYDDPYFKIAASGNRLLYSDSNQTFLAMLGDTLSQTDLGIHPVQEGQSPAVSMAADGSWMIGGFWGTWLGLDAKSSRLSPYVSIGELGSMALAHNGQKGSFVVVGDDDGDFGALADLPTQGRSWGVFPHVNPIKAVPELTSSEWWWTGGGFDELESLMGPAPKPGALLAVIDTGMNHEVQSQSPVAFLNPKEEANGIDDDDNGLVDDRWGYDFVTDTGVPQDKHGHGTHVYGIAARTLSQPWYQVVSLRALDQGGRSNSIDLSRAIRYAISLGADVINCSWGGGRPTLALADALAEAVAHDILVFTSAGNGSTNTDLLPQVPGLFPGVYGVGAIDRNQRRARFSNYGAKSVFIGAPGVNISSDALGGGKRRLSGTSMASPMVASTAARLQGFLKNLYPSFGARDRKILVRDSLCLMPGVSQDFLCNLLDGGSSFRKLTGILDQEWFH